MRGMLDTGSMSCTFSLEAEQKLLAENVDLDKKPLPENIVLVGVGGKMVQPKCLYKVRIKGYGICCQVPIFVIPGQHDDLIFSTNLIKTCFIKLVLKIKSSCTLESNEEHR